MEHILMERKGKAAWIYLNRPEKLNSLNTKLMDELIEALRKAEEDLETKIIIITGKGKTFSAGIDLREVAEAKSPDDSAAIFRKLAGLFRALLALEKPLIMAVNGHAYGGGAELLWAADIVIAVKGPR